MDIENPYPAHQLVIDEMHGILDKAEDEKRELSRREKVKLSELEAQARELGEKIREHQRNFDPRLAIGVEPLDARASIVLTCEQRFAEWQETRRGGTAREQIDGEGAFRLGAVARAMVTGDRGSLTDLEQRARSLGVDANGGFLVPEPLAARVIDRVRNAARVIQAGALTVPMEVNELNLARMTGGSTAYWKSENAAVTESDQTYDRIQLKAKTAVVLQRMSQELFEDLSPEADAIIEREIALALALKLDLAVLRGSGVDPEPKGIRNQTGVNIVSLGANGATPTNFTFLVDAVSVVRTANGEPNAAIYSSRTQTTVDKFADTTNQPLRPPATVEELRKLVSNQIPNNLTVGTSTDCSEAYVGDWSSVLIGVRPNIGIRLRVLQERYADNLQIGLLAWLRADVALAHPEHMAVVTGIRA